ncbi:zinc-ribbon domain-containing protein [Pontixanthobacter aquaemixtae]|uniref:Thioredoxin n=1 Tax=Pontixanthobacter aquaemixtae TaxID=1958940 RepID=A0A844ZUJ0_9SPHN|nr:zinc-ribbon domain-containing protein [Pontixanthobacter aquaemixtae]MXO89209.1 thioredoxin [Pontixanthobacter aquaemixtae]
MIIACPACSTKYVVPDTAIGVDGRTVRCAKCRHSWHQDGPELDLGDFEKTPEAAPVPSPRPTPAPAPAPTPAPVQQPAPAAEEPKAPASDTKPGFSNTHATAPEPEADETPPADRDTGGLTEDADSEQANSEDDGDDQEIPPPPTVVEAAEDEADAEPEPETFYYDETSQFDYEPPFRSRRNPLKIWTAAAAAFAVIALGIVAAVSYYGVPDWVPLSKPTFAVAQPDLVLEFPADQQDRRTLPNGSEFFGASGTVTNTGRETQRVPSILIVMRNERNTPIYSWEVVPPKSTLAPGESMTINEAVRDVPKAAKFAEIGWKPN